jgi:ribulose-phosphate 3-epimerase
MSVPAGFGGQEFDGRVLDKVGKLAEKKEKIGYKYAIQVDGGVTLENISAIKNAGADEVSVGRRLFDGDLVDNINKFSEMANSKK